MPDLAVTVAVPKAREAAPGGRKPVPPEELAVHVSIANPSDRPVPFNVLQAQHPSLALEVEGPSGMRVLLPPPSAPSEAELGRGEPIEPGSSVTLEYRAFLDPALGPGTFRARYVGRVPALGGTPDDPLVSDWVDFEVPPPPPWPKPWWPYPWRYAFDRLRRYIDIVLFWRKCRRVWEAEVDEAVSETITNAPPGSEAWNGTYGWRARFHLRIEQPTCRVIVTVRIRVTGAVTPAQQTAWETAIEGAWSNIFKLCAASRCCGNGYAIVADVQFVSSGEHQVVVAGASTVNMGNWGAADAVDVRHEFGHMLGALDEYFTVNGTDFGPGRQATGAIMNNPANAPVARHYELVRTRSQALMGAACTTKAAADPC
jgi:hypothetical protein